MALEVEQRFSLVGVCVCGSTTIQQQLKVQREPEEGPPGLAGGYLLEFEKEKVRGIA